MNELPRRARNRIAREQVILSAALEIFSQAGFSGATMEAVALRAEISKPTLYQYFPNKAALFDAMMANKRSEMGLAIDEADPQNMVPQLYRFCMAYAQTVMRPDMLALARLIIGEAQRFPEIGRAYQAAGPDRLLADIKGYLDAQKAAERLAFNDTELAADDLWGLVLSAPRNRALYDPDVSFGIAELDRYVQNGLQVFLRAYSTAVADDLEVLLSCRAEHLEGLIGRQTST